MHYETSTKLKYPLKTDYAFYIHVLGKFIFSIFSQNLRSTPILIKLDMHDPYDKDIGICSNLGVGLAPKSTITCKNSY